MASAARASTASQCARAPTSGCCTTTSATRRRSSSPCSRPPTRASARPRRRCRCSTSTRSKACAAGRFHVELLLAHPEFLTLLNSENLHRARHLKRSREVRAMNSPLIETLSELLVRGRRRRRRSAPASIALQLYISIAALRLFLSRQQSHAFGDLRTRSAAPRAQRARLAHMTDRDRSATCVRPRSGRLTRGEARGAD